MSAPITTNDLRLFGEGTPRRDWRDDAACRTADPEVFFPLTGGDHGPARAYCAACPVRAECLQDALRTGDGGVRGGLSEDARAQLRRARRCATAQQPVTTPGPADDTALDVAPPLEATPEQQDGRGAEPAADVLDEQVHAATAVQPQVAGAVDRAIVRGLVEGRGPAWASRWEVALAAVVLLERGLTVTATARALGEEYVQVKRWRDRRDTARPLVVADRGTARLRRPERLVGPQPPTTMRPGREARTRGAA